MAAMTVLREHELPNYVAGLSLEYGALVAAGALVLRCPTMVRRGHFMQAVPFGIGAMAAIIGLPTE